MKNARRSLKRFGAAAVLAGLSLASPVMTQAATPTVETDHGAYVRLVGNPADGTAKFQFGWGASTDASAAAGYWIGVYDVTNSHYEWSFDTGATDLPDQLMRNAKPTTGLPNGEYKVVYFVREAYGSPATNIAEIELPFSVTNSMY